MGGIKEVRKVVVIKNAIFNTKDYMCYESGCYADCSCDSDTVLSEDCNQA